MEITKERLQILCLRARLRKNENENKKIKEILKDYEYKRPIITTKYRIN